MRYSTSPSRKTDRRASRPSYLIFRSRSITNTFSEKLCCCMNAHALADESVSAPPPNVFHLNSLCRSSSRSNCVDFWRMNSPAGATRHRCGVTGELCKTRTSRLAPGHLCCSSPFRVSGAQKEGSMPRHKSLLTVIRELVEQEVRSAMQALLGSFSTAKPAKNERRRRRRRRGPGRPPGSKNKKA